MTDKSNIADNVVRFPPRIHTVENGTKVNEGVFISWEEHESLLRQARAATFEEAAVILRDESEGDIDYALFLLKELGKPSSEASIKRLEKTIAEQLERAARAGDGDDLNQQTTKEKT